MSIFLTGIGKISCVVFNNNNVLSIWKIQQIMQLFKSPYPCILKLHMDLLMSLPQLPVLLPQVINTFCGSDISTAHIKPLNTVLNALSSISPSRYI